MRRVILLLSVGPTAAEKLSGPVNKEIVRATTARHPLKG
jgi:hypothetical protein